MKKSDHYKIAITAVIEYGDIEQEDKIETLETLFDDLGHAKWREAEEAKKAVNNDGDT